MPKGIYSREPAQVRFWAKVKIVESDCWEWQGSCRKGYGCFWDGKKIVVTHRFAYEIFYGAIPTGLTLDHLCRNTKCVNPDHIEPVTQRDNVLRGVGLTAKNAFATHCPQGHPYDLFNTYLKPNGNRSCRICRIEAKRRWLSAKVIRMLGNIEPNAVV